MSSTYQPGSLLVSGNNARAGAQQWFLLLAASTSEEAMKLHAIESMCSLYLCHSIQVTFMLVVDAEMD